VGGRRGGERQPLAEEEDERRERRTALVGLLDLKDN
jgi:hypothetical protein